MRTLALLPLLPLLGCAASRGHTPVPAGQVAWTASLGGPVVEYFDGLKPLPLSALGGAYGVDGRTTVHGAILPTGLALFGVLGLEGGASHLLWEGESSRLMADGSLWVFAGPHNGAASIDYDPAPGGLRVFPEGQLLWARDLGPHTVYAGASLFVQPWPDPTALPAPLLGAEVRLGRLGLQPELSWVEAWKDNEPYSPQFLGVSGHGALSLRLGLTLHPGGGR
ncbi:MAG: hypothetical protein JXX28_11780 [Deltaproteobacteria bacterium]|nr:hypothetical protein [Deltaproteobacteria bacterium]